MKFFEQPVTFSLLQFHDFLKAQKKLYQMSVQLKKYLNRPKFAVFPLHVHT